MAVEIADGRDLSGYAWSLVPFRCLIAVRTPPSDSVWIESEELECTCPDEWHRSLVLTVGATVMANEAMSESPETSPEASATDTPPPASTVMKETGVGFAPANPRTSKVVMSPQRTPIFGSGKRGRKGGKR